MPRAVQPRGHRNRPILRGPFPDGGGHRVPGSLGKLPSRATITIGKNQTM